MPLTIASAEVNVTIETDEGGAGVVAIGHDGNRRNSWRLAAKGTLIILLDIT